MYLFISEVMGKLLVVFRFIVWISNFESVLYVEWVKRIIGNFSVVVRMDDLLVFLLVIVDFFFKVGVCEV